jgi:hypothetical protein
MCGVTVKVADAYTHPSHWIPAWTSRLRADRGEGTSMVVENVPSDDIVTDLGAPKPPKVK